MKLIGQLVILVFLALIGPEVRAQTDSTSSHDEEPATTFYYRVTTKDGNHYYGKVLDENLERVVLQDVRFGKVFILRKDIISIEIEQEGERLNAGKPRRSVFNKDRPAGYGISPSAVGLGRGVRHFNNVGLFFNQIGVGINDHLDFNFGTFLLFGPTQVRLNAHTEIVDNIHIAGGVSAGYPFIGYPDEAFIFPHVGVGFGNKRNNFSFYQGFGASAWYTNRSITMLGFQTEFMPKADLWGEMMWVHDHELVVAQVCLRTTKNRGTSWDFGLIYSSESDQFDGSFDVFQIILPSIGYNIYF